MVPQVAIDAVLFYLGRNVSKEIAVGMVSVLYAGESHLNPGSGGVMPPERGGALNPNGAYGIADWNGPRQQALADFAQRLGLIVGDLETQLHFVLTECANSARNGGPYTAVWNAIQAKVMSYSDFIPLFVTKYEVPADPQAEINRAVTFANDLYPAIPATAPTPTPAPIQEPPTPVPPTPAPATPAPLVPALHPATIAQLAPIIEAITAGIIRILLVPK